ncbi:RNA polymerase sigma factor SigJ [Streptomyces chiangmaiensis]|uniref:RNA polymerase sigma factor SigJ n=1 Tax=Streptomyces chiangmaiensis TaxID=766497 RepID=A0ABU7FK55_9ACTN|nr:RNA polymerase sigma factor SigJ [Streptomyces chiangmaiensis]MED7824490.1 RNA polymerase sigma factor SigJ [Streptomyces chiangmaiensis]
MSTTPEPGHDRSEGGLSAIVGERRHLTNVAYRLLGSLTEAEDVVQEAYARWYAMPRAQREAVESPGAWLTTVAGRICLDLLGSARVRRERYVGEWIPEPLLDRTEWISGPVSGDAADPAGRVTLDESVDMAFLVVLESMTPAERVAFILHDVFRYAFAEIAVIVGRTPVACRQLASSARRRVRAASAAEASAVPVAGRAGLVRSFKEAWEARDIEALVGLLDPGATLTADGGGLAATVVPPVEGSERIAAYILRIADIAPGLTLLERAVNGQPGLVAQRSGVTVTVAAFELTGARIARIWVIRNPEKLRPWTDR